MRNLVEGIRKSLEAKLQRLMSRPIIAAIDTPRRQVPANEVAPDAFRALLNISFALQPSMGGAGQWIENADEGTSRIRVTLDYDGLWRGREREVLETVKSSVEGEVSLLTENQKQLLVSSPREFLALQPRPLSAELISFEQESVGGSQRVTEITVATPSEGPTHIKYVAIVPNLVQIERQLAALRELEGHGDDSVLAPLRSLVGLSDANGYLATPARECKELADPQSLDRSQIDCIRSAAKTPHFAVIKGPPGSGKTTVIKSVVQQAIDAGERVLVVSPTHVAVDNVVEKLVLVESEVTREPDLLEARSLPVRFAGRSTKLSEAAKHYWVGSKTQRRAVTVSQRIARRLSETIPFAAALYAMEATESAAASPLSSAIAGVEAVICGTPIGILSCESVKNAAPGSFDLLIVDEVSKMTLPEFLAIAVKAKRWVLVGDPQQLPPFNDCEENAVTLDDIIEPELELVCSVGALIESTQRSRRLDRRILVVASRPKHVAEATLDHLKAVLPGEYPPVSVFGDSKHGIVFCSPVDYEEACSSSSYSHGLDRWHSPDSNVTRLVLVERGLRVRRPADDSGCQIFDARKRAQSLIFETSFNVYHARPWCVRSGQKLHLEFFRNGLNKYLPSVEALCSLDDSLDIEMAKARREGMIEAIAERLAINSVSIYDWLVGIPCEHMDVSPLRELGGLPNSVLCEAIQPYTGTLRRQYRMHPSLSKLPRELFYFNEALVDAGDASREPSRDCRVVLQQVEGTRDAESNDKEVEVICNMLRSLNGQVSSEQPQIMIITPYREQEQCLNDATNELRRRKLIDNLKVEVCTLDRCQGREAEYVLVSLVRSKASQFMNSPKRWNVALTRAKTAMAIIGNVDAYLDEARKARKDPKRRQRSAGYGREEAELLPPLMSLLARIIDGYHVQILESQTCYANQDGSAYTRITT